MFRTIIKKAAAGRLVLVAALLAVAFVVLVPAAAFATVIPFATTAPGGAGTGSGVGEVWPWGFGVITNTNGTVWGDDAGDTYAMWSPRETTTVVGTDRDFVAWVDKNPVDYESYIKLRDLDASPSVDTTPTFIWKSRYYVALPSYTDSWDHTYNAGTNAWFITIDPGTLIAGHTYQLRFLRGIKANNYMTCVTYTPLGEDELGYIRLDGIYTDYTDPDQLQEYADHKFDTYEFRCPTQCAYEDFTFEFEVTE